MGSPDQSAKVLRVRNSIEDKDDTLRFLPIIYYLAYLSIGKRLT